MIDFDKFKDKSPEDQALEFYVCLSNLERMQRKIAQDTSNILELLTAKKTEKEIKAEFKTPVAEKPTPVAQSDTPPAQEPEPEQPEEPTDGPEFVQGAWIDISGTMKDDPTLRKGTSAAGKDWKLASFRMDLPTATVKITLWNELAAEAMQYVAGENIALNGMLVKEFYEGTPQLNSGNYTKITVL